jgi:hypothetical protein
MTINDYPLVETPIMSIEDYSMSITSIISQSKVGPIRSEKKSNTPPFAAGDLWKQYGIRERLKLTKQLKDILISMAIRPRIQIEIRIKG